MCFYYTGHLECAWGFEREPILSTWFLSLSCRFWCFCYILIINVVIWCETYICIYHWRSIFRLFLEEFQTFVAQFLLVTLHITFVICIFYVIYFYFCWTDLFAVLIAFMVCIWYIFRLHISVCQDIFLQSLLYVF